MNARNTNRRWLLGSVLLVSAAWLALSGDRTSADSVSEPTGTVLARSPVPQASAQPGGAQLSLDIVPRGVLIAASTRDSARDLFAAHSWAPPPVPPAPVEPQAPVAPPLPFAYLGKKLEGEDWEVFLARGEQTFVVKQGAVVDGAWRVEKVQPPMLALTYLPLGQPQTLSIGDPQ